MRIEDFTILVVDDDALARSIIVEYLQAFGFQHIVQYSGGESAIKYVQDVNKPVHLVLSDWEMPGSNGLALLKAVRQLPQRKHLKFMMITSQRSQERFKISQAAKWRVDAYLMKPFRGQVLKDKILELLQEPEKKAVGE